MIAVGGSKLKAECVQECCPGATIRAVAVGSGVREQPVGRMEIMIGAITRAKSALCGEPDAAMAFGVENGLIHDEPSNQWHDVACVVCMNRDYTFSGEWSDPVVVPDEWVELSGVDTYAVAAKRAFHLGHTGHTFVAYGR